LGLPNDFWTNFMSSTPHIQPDHKKTALITGASGGIGYELTKLFARDGYRLVLIARNSATLDRVALELKELDGTPTTIIVEDLSRPAAAEDVFAQLLRAGITVDVLVNNAGFGSYGFFSESDLTNEQRMVNLNITSLISLTRLLLPAMIGNRKGRILNVASTAAFQPGPLMAVYFASKAFVLSFSEALDNELRGSGVTVTALCPGPTNTGFQARAGNADTRLFDRRMTMDPARVAAIGYKGLMKGKAMIIPGFKNKLLARAVKVAPRVLATKVARFIQERKK
jgi:short-subunit dehydrogenase